MCMNLFISIYPSLLEWHLLNLYRLKENFIISSPPSYYITHRWHIYYIMGVIMEAKQFKVKNMNIGLIGLLLFLTMLTRRYFLLLFLAAVNRI